MPPADNPPTSPTDLVHHLILSRLTARGSRFTPARRQVADALEEAGGPRTVGEIARVLSRAVPLSSLYRSLALFEEAGLVTRERHADGIARYELSEALTGHHHHQVCVSCGDVRDLVIDQAADEELDRLLRRAGTGDGFLVSSHRIDLEGTCASCTRA
jgi:Fur family ferric uptake transcriptional regulator